MVIFIKNFTKKYINVLSNSNTNTTNILFLRKARLFVKSRYSRNRQWSKSIVYFCLWFNVISVLWTIYYCYRYIFIFSHLYWLGFVFVGAAAFRFSKLAHFANIQKFVSNWTFKF